MGAETIAAIATPNGTAGVAMIRITGPEALSIAAKMIRPAGTKKVEKLKGYTGLYGRVFSGEGDIDDVVLFVYRAPKSYTGEDVAEICCHGGVWIARKILRRCYELGAMPAAPGEFTKRALLNGKLTLTQAEAVADLIAAEGDQEASMALAARDGAVTRAINQIKEALVHASASLAAWIDYPEEEQEEVFVKDLLELMRDQHARLGKMIDQSQKKCLLSSGVRTAIVGKPNVGKSTLMNLLSGSPMSIVTEIAGTTRDIVEGQIRIGGIKICLCDTAGIRDTDDPVEAAGVTRAIERMRSSQLILAVLDGSASLTAEDKQILSQLKDKPVVAVVNKSDLGIQAAMDEISSYTGWVASVSAKTGEGVKDLEKAIREAMDIHHLDPEAAILAGDRQLSCALDAQESLCQAIQALNDGITLDAVNVCLDGAIGALLTLTGESVGEAVINEVFSKFCVGK